MGRTAGIDLENKIYLGDCFELIKQIPDNSIDLIVTDPPYKFAGMVMGGGAFGTDTRDYYDDFLELYHKTGASKETERLRVIANSKASRIQLNKLAFGFDLKILDEFERIMKKTNIYIWCSKNQLGDIIKYYENKGINIDVLTWHKTNPIPTCNNTYLSDTEYCVFAREKGVKVRGTYHTKRKYYVTQANVEDKKKYGHPTIKPEEIIKNLIINSSLEDAVVFDPFMGSGTTCVCAKDLGRKYLGFEIDEKYYEISKKRINKEFIEIEKPTKKKKKEEDKKDYEITLF